MEKIEWFPSEWHESKEALGTWFKGYEGDVYPDDDGSGNWVARVDATSQVSEWPECYSIDFVPTRELAIAVCEKNLRRAARGVE